MPATTAGDWITHLQLQKHIEGGWYSEIYRSEEKIENENRSLCTHIYFLLQENDFSALHCIQSDELWHFYHGDNLIVYELERDGLLTQHKLGTDITNGFLPFCMIKKGSWFGARVSEGGSFSLVGCTVSPGFDFKDLVLANAGELSLQYPSHKKLIASLCRH
ncbi:MAG TPA: cupin domain-containing protein [Chitinophagaceae bacterium]